MVISNGLAEDTELHYTHSLYPEEPFLVIRAKKEKTRASHRWCERAKYIIITYGMLYFPKKAPNFKKYEVNEVLTLTPI